MDDRSGHTDLHPDLVERLELVLTLVDRLVASAEPAFALSPLAEVCAPDLGDGCTVELVEDGVAPYRITLPDRACGSPSALAAALPNTRQLMNDPSTPVVSVDTIAVAICGVDPIGTSYVGAITCTDRTGTAPPAADVPVLQLLVRHTVWETWLQRPEHAWSAEHRHTDDLEKALQSDRRISMAMGIIMDRLGLPEKAAFDYLRQLSQHTNSKLSQVAAHLVLTGALAPPPNARPNAPLRAPGNDHHHGGLGDRYVPVHTVTASPPLGGDHVKSPRPRDAYVRYGQATEKADCPGRGRLEVGRVRARGAVTCYPWDRR